MLLRRSSRVLLVGVMFFVLGAGNWTMSRVKLAQYKQLQLEAIAIGGMDVSQPFRGTESILDERTDAHELYEDAVTRYRYYKLVRRGGRFLMGIGCLLMMGALVRRIAVPAPPVYQ